MEGLHLPKQVSQKGFRFILFRHSQSKHNTEKINGRKEKLYENSAAYKSSPEYLKIKFSPQLLDKNTIDKSLVQEARKMIDFEREVGLIITSPLGRCLQTCRELLKQTSTKIKVYIEPLITSRISTAWSVGLKLHDKKKQYPEFDYSQMRQVDSHWIMEVLQGYSQGKSKDEPIKEPEDILQHISEGNAESYHNIMLRIQDFKRKLKEFYLLEPSVKTGKRVLIISHNCLMKYLAGTYVNEKGKVDGTAQFQHCEPVYFTEHFILEGSFITASTTLK